jgi:hypothetical protein
MFVVGCGVIILSVFMLPWIILNPGAFANLFNLGQLIILASFALLWGPKKFFIDMLCNGVKKVYAIGYLISLLCCMYFSVIKSSYIMTLLCLLVEIIFMSYVVATYFPNGI